MSDIARLNDFFSAADNFFAEKTNRGLLHSAHSNNRFVLVACCLTTLNGIFALRSLPVFSDGLADSQFLCRILLKIPYNDDQYQASGLVSELDARSLVHLILAVDKFRNQRSRIF